MSLSVTVSMGELNRGMFSRIASELGADVHLGRNHVAIAGLQQNVVEGQAERILDFLLHGGPLLLKRVNRVL